MNPFSAFVNAHLFWAKSPPTSRTVALILSAEHPRRNDRKSEPRGDYIARQMDDFATRGAPLDYWFWKVQSGSLSFLVDFIVRRERGQGEVRVSLWVDGKGRVERSVSEAWSASQSEVAISGCVIRPTGSKGEVADIAWDLEWEPGAELMDTHPRWFGPMRMADLDVTARPMGLLSGRVTVSGRTFTLEHASVATYHYWGRRLPDRWTWISANEFENAPGLRLEAGVATSRLWGRGRMPNGVGYLWWTDGERSHFTLSPVTGLLRHSRNGDGVTINALGIGNGRHRIRASAPPDALNDLGEGIRQTLLGDLEFDGHRAVHGRVGLEFRGR